MDSASMETIEAADELENSLEEPTTSGNPNTHLLDSDKLNYNSILDEMEYEEHPELPEDPIGKSSVSEFEASPSKNENDESQEFPLSETASVKENSYTSPLSPDCYWSDEKIDEGEFEEFPFLSEDQVIQLGEVMIIMLCQGPPHRLEEIIAALAFNIRDPQNMKTCLLMADKCGETPSSAGISMEGCESLKIGSSLKGIGLPETILELEKLIDRHKYSRKEDLKDVGDVKCIVKEKGNEAKGYDCRAAIKEFFRVTFQWDDEFRAAFYCFLAAFLMRSGVKHREVMAKHWSKAPDMFGVFYPSFKSPPAPLLSRRAFRMLNKEFRPGTKLIKTVMRAFLKKMFEPELPQNVKDCLKYTLLSHTSYYGMKLVTLTDSALRILGDRRLKTIQKFDSDDNRAGVNALIQHFSLYCEGGPLKSRFKYLPWCRMLDMKYWSNLSPKAHPTLATLLMCIQYDENIWNMKSFKITEECKVKSKEMAKRIQHDTMKRIYKMQVKFGAI